MADKSGLFIVPNRVTVSTAGIVPKIYELAKIEDRPHLAISLSAPNDELRDKLMPINKRWNIDELMTACKEFEKSLKPGERFTFEYVMLDELNDTGDHARQLANLLNRHGLQRVKINLIPHNSADPLEYRASSWEKIERFQDILAEKGVNAFVRKPRGRDIYAACGQLAAKDSPNLVQIGV
jgi:23S rRNA (adenine2503-C2)-methyltransferase